MNNDWLAGLVSILADVAMVLFLLCIIGLFAGIIFFTVYGLVTGKI